MRDSMIHRGPDDAGEWWSVDGRVGLAHRRLSIIDLSPGGHQPMLDARGELALTFNGEIYNYKDVKAELEACGHAFRTASDTEVILEAYREWGTDCLSRLTGMFAFALYDTPRRTLFAARDRAGEKPLFYRHDPGRLVFASELKALMSLPDLPRQLDPEALEFYLAYGYVPGGRCVLQGFRKLPAAHAMIYNVEQDGLNVRRFWDLPEYQPVDSSGDELAEQLHLLLRDSVRRQLVADVPVGILLSGGIDSSLVTAMAAESLDRPVKTFTITFPGHAVHDEAPYARMVASHFGTSHTELVAEPATVELLPELARQYDEPMADSSMVPTYLVSKLIRQHATVALGGDGGDELFGGYTHYSSVMKTGGWLRGAPGPFRRLVHAGATRALPVGFRGRSLVARQTSDPGEEMTFPPLFDHAARRGLLATEAAGHPEKSQSELARDRATLLQRATSLDFRAYLPDDILVKVDRASMLVSLEVRAPWLDARIIEFAFGRVPDRLRATTNERKILPRMLAARLLPPELDLTRKQGFSLPLASWFKGPWGDYIESVVSEADPAVFNPRTIKSLIAGQRKGYSNTERLFTLAMFELWRRHYNVGMPA